jgi:hypothetical protein
MLPVAGQDDEITIESRTMTAEQIEATLAGDGVQVVSKVDLSDKPGETPAPATEPPKTVEELEAERVTAEAEGQAEADLAGVPEVEEHTGRRLSGAARAKIARQKLQDERDALKRRVEELERAKPAETPAAQPAPAPAPVAAGPDPDATAKPEPDPDTYPDGVLDRGYIKAVARWEREEAAREERVEANKAAERQAQERQAKEAEASAKAWTSKVDAAKALHPDYDDVLKRSGDLPFSAATHVALRDSDVAPQILYFLATHPEEAKRICDATLISPTDPPRVAARKQALAFEEVEKIEGALKQPPSPAPAIPPVPAAGEPAPKKPVPAKPVPVTPVGHAGGSSARKYSDYTPDELREWDPADANHPISKAYVAEFGRRPY